MRDIDRREEAKQRVIDALDAAIPTELGPAWSAGFNAGFDAGRTPPCRWVEDLDGIWHTDCGEAFEIQRGGPDANGLRYCCFCGKPMHEETT